MKMSLEKAIEQFKSEFVSIPVEDVKYWEDGEMFLGNVIVWTEHHPKGSTIGFEFYDPLRDGICIAYKPLSCYHKWTDKKRLRN